MYEQFSDRARKVMQLANQEAQRFNHEYIGTEHVLLGLIKAGRGVAANVLKNLDIDLRKIRLEVEKLLQSGPDMVTMGKLPQTPRAKKVIECSMEEARNLNHNYVGTEHILLGLLREQEGVAAQVLMNLGLTVWNVREEVIDVLAHASAQELRPPAATPSNPPPSAGQRPPARSMLRKALACVADFLGLALGAFHAQPKESVSYEGFDDRARKVMKLARQEARRFNHEYIGTEHILLGLIKEGSGVGANVLSDLGLDLRKIHTEVERIVQSGPDMVTMGRLPHTPRAKMVIEYAKEEARNLNHNHVGTEHLLLGLLREGQGVAGQVLINLLLELDDVREAVLKVLKRRADDASQVPPPKTDGPYERFTVRARMVMRLANQEAQRFNHEYISTAHLLLGVIKEGAGVGAIAFKNLDVDLRTMRIQLEKLAPGGRDMVTGKLPLTPCAKHALEHASEVARNLCAHYVGSEHVLLGLLRDRDGLAAQMLVGAGLTAEVVRIEVLKVLGRRADDDSKERPPESGPP